MKWRITLGVLIALVATYLLGDWAVHRFGSQASHELNPLATKEFLDEHWRSLPAAMPAEGGGWPAHADSLLPQSCGRCHALQLTDRSGSRHSRAMGPGVLIQLLDDEAGMDSCNRCHAPLREQRPAPLGERGNERFMDSLRGHGLVCAACHVREGQVFGPPQLNFPRAHVSEVPGKLAHGPISAAAAFESSLFCASCHQFGPGELALGGKYLENTYVEWAQSPQGQRGMQCQTCHMPGRRHLWRGIHDPAMTAGALALELTLREPRLARASLTSREVGHMFPTYVTPRATLILEAYDAVGQLVAREDAVIQRRIDIYLETELFDTRLAPGETLELDLSWGEDEGVVLIRAYLLVEPDEFYDRFFAAYTPLKPHHAALLDSVRAEIRAGIYTILESERHLERG